MAQAELRPGPGSAGRPSGSERPSSVDVLVVGAGPTGLALAAQLREFGVRFRIIEQRLDGQPSRAFIIQPRTLEVLDPLGLGQELVAAGDPSARVELRAGRRRAALTLAAAGSSGTGHPYLLAMPQAAVEQVLAGHLETRGVVVERGVRLIDLRLDGGEAARCRLRHPDGGIEQLDVAFVVGCDGVDSTVRSAAGIPFPARTYRTQLLLADVDLHGDLDLHTVHGAVDRLGVVFLFPFPAGAGWRLLAVLDDGDADRPDAVVVAERIARSFAGHAAMGQLHWAQRVTLRRAQAASYRRGPVFVAGDAAHVHSPAGAQGMNSGIQDAVNLGWKLALAVAGSGSPGLLASYSAERWPVARWTRRLTDLAFVLEAGNLGPLDGLRYRLAPALAAVVDGRPFPGPAFRLLGGLLTRYRLGSPQAEDGEPRLHRRPHPGARMPDGVLRTDAGNDVHLHQLLRPAGFHVLLCAPVGAPGATRTDRWSSVGIGPLGPVPVTVHWIVATPSPGSLHDPGGRFLHQLRVPAGGATYVVRPDGYIGYRCGGTGPDGAARHLAAYRPRRQR